MEKRENIKLVFSSFCLSRCYFPFLIQLVVHSCGWNERWCTSICHRDTNSASLQCAMC